MIAIQDILISDALVEEYFLCNLAACKGACCWEGDFGAPLEKEEMEILDRIYDKIEPFLTEEGKTIIEKQGKYIYFKDMEGYGTSLLKNGACVFLTSNKEGIAQCGIELAFNQGKIDFKKPISCHLYPIRIKSEEALGFEAMNYDKWDICSAACTLGKKEKMPLYRFGKDAIIRKYGKAFYEELDAAAKFIQAKKRKDV